MDLRAFNKWYFNTVKTCFTVILACGTLYVFHSWYFRMEIVRVSKKNFRLTSRDSPRESNIGDPSYRDNRVNYTIE